MSAIFFCGCFENIKTNTLMTHAAPMAIERKIDPLNIKLSCKGAMSDSLIK